MQPCITVLFTKGRPDQPGDIMPQLCDLVQGKLQGRLLDFSTPQPIDECLAILGESMVREKEVTAVMGVYAKAVKDGDVSPFA